MLKKRELKNWKLNWQLPNMLKLYRKDGGYRNQRLLNNMIYIMLLIMALYELTNKEEGILKIILYSIPFLILITISLLLNNRSLDISTNIIMAVMFIFTMETGDLSAVIFIIFVFFTLENMKQLIISGSIFILSLAISSFINSIPTMNIFIMIIGYIYVLSKYYYTIHKPINKLYQRVKFLEHELAVRQSHLFLTHDQILQKYPFMYYKETNSEKENNPHRKIQDLQMLLEDKGCKEISYINNISENSQSREFAKLRKEFAIALRRENPINTIQGLIVAGIKLGIIQVETIHP